ncbi:MAG: MBL fold metallo-hydrolase [Lachnospiraceae bacterium]|nr:MBL fold metallo-hydrolase [Lachnospiraceae bacterium]
MRIINLVENTLGASGCEFAHGLSFYIKTNKHKLLMDLGPSDISLRNAKMLGIDLKEVDTVVLSHGHYDHSGGIIPFANLNKTATIYMQDSADGEYYADDGADLGELRYRFIGIDKRISELPNLKKIKGDYKIDDELSLFTIKERTNNLPSTNKRILKKTKDGYLRDDFKHEHYLVLSEGDKNVLISGCAHNGILSILDEYKALYNSEPDLVVSGFHLMKKVDYNDEEIEEIRHIAKELTSYKTKFVTCHCTGLYAFEIMKEIMGEQLDYAHSGDEIKF